jgi:hypothetical protein
MGSLAVTATIDAACSTWPGEIAIVLLAAESTTPVVRTSRLLYGSITNERFGFVTRT